MTFSSQHLISGLPPIQSMLKQQALSANKTLGQNFLLDLNITRKIVRMAGSLKDKLVIEIGPGPGGLTRALLESEAQHVIAIEKDPRFIDFHQPLLDIFPERFQLIQKDAMMIDVTSLSKQPPIIIANLPYNIATPLLIGWLHQIHAIEKMVLMFQKEVAMRMTATSGNKHYGRLSVLCQTLTDCSIVMNLPPSAFTPPPKVHSAVISLTPKEPCKEKIAFLPALEKITAQAFGQRRKMIRSSLKPLFTEPRLIDLGFDPTARAENLSVDDYQELAKTLI